MRAATVAGRSMSSRWPASGTISSSASGMRARGCGRSSGGTMGSASPVSTSGACGCGAATGGSTNPRSQRAGRRSPTALGGLARRAAIWARADLRPPLARAAVQEGRSAARTAASSTAAAWRGATGRADSRARRRCRHDRRSEHETPDAVWCRARAAARHAPPNDTPSTSASGMAERVEQVRGLAARPCIRNGTTRAATRRSPTRRRRWSECRAR